MRHTLATRRRLGEHERLLNFLHRYRGLIVMQVMHVDGVVDPARLADALAWLQRHHPMARAHVRLGAPVPMALPPYAYFQPWFETEGTRPIPLRQSSAPWQEELQRELRRPIRGWRQPRLRATLVTGQPDGLTRILIAADHAVVDAHSCNMLTRDLLDYLAGPVTAEARVPDLTELPPSAETIVPQRKTAKPARYVPAIRLPLGRKPRGRAETRVLDLRLSPGQLASLTQAARVNRTTLHGVIGATFLLAIRKRYGLNEMTCLSTLDLRRMAKPALPAGTFGCYIDILRTHHRISNDLWTTARDVSLRLITTIAGDRSTASILKQPDWTTIRAESWPTITGRYRLDGLAITTAGDSGLRETYGALRLERVTMSVALDAVGPSLMIIGSERNGGLDLSINYSTMALSSEEAESIGRQVIAVLTEIPVGLEVAPA